MFLNYIEFRGFDGASWKYDMCVDYVEETNTWYMLNRAKVDDWFIVGDVGRYTGVKDRNMVKIFTGDNVEVRDEQGNVLYSGEVDFVYGSFGIKNRGSLYATPNGSQMFVVGNIYNHDDL